ncbi:Crp/Fnr family transcriptional regulator [Pseudomonas sp. C11]|uniref:Crp/Fnr family transcriptional regulator n=1 Tax=Pseudomonas sp. C11 TaxID=3075550 RepID=UPI002AFFE8A8|nr:Crp/Fnr family transcriptional regulator [Pseudomonas sp. C11]
MSAFNWVEDLSDEIQKAFLEQARERVLPDGAIVYRQGDQVREVFQIVSGEIRQCVFTEDGQEVLFYIYKPGDLVCDSAVDENEPYAATITTRGETRLRVWSTKELRSFRARFPEVESALSVQMSRRLRGAVRLIGELLTQSVASRIASRLLWLHELERGMALSISQADLGLMVGATRQSVNLVLKDMRKHKVIEANYGQILVTNAAGLSSYAAKSHRLGRSA